MTTDEYRAYQEAFNAGIEGMTGLASGSRLSACQECCSEHDTFECGEVSYQNVTAFSYYRCSICESTLGGNRTVAHAWYNPLTDDIEDSLAHLRICDDCVYYLEYGRLDDATMAEMTA
jgi:hypothetical protein